MEYLTIYRPYKPAELITKAKSKTEGGYFDEAETKNWDDALNKKAKDGYRVINSGVIVIEGYVTFWAMLEKA
jgi:hypothetical protein